jgi:hypothetical protein
LANRVGPVVCDESERFAVLRWVWHLDREEPATLVLGSLERAALIEVARAVNALPGNRQWATLWPKLLERAKVADRAPTDPDWKRLHDSLAVLARVLESPAAKAIPPLYRTVRKPAPAPPRQETPQSLVGVLAAMQWRSEGPPVGR